MNEGTAKLIGDDYHLRFERDLSHPIDKVWAALTEPARIGQWLSADADIDLRVGGRIRLGEHTIDSTITELDPPRLIQYGWVGPHWDGGGQVRWELEPRDGTTHLVLTHVFHAMSDDETAEFRAKFDRFELPEGWEPLSSTLAGWHSLLDRLAVALGGADASTFEQDAWQQLMEHYKKVTVR